MTGGRVPDGMAADETAPDAVFTSLLSAGESLLVQEAGFEPTGVVMGSSVCHVGLKPPATSVAQVLHGPYGTAYSADPLNGGELTDLGVAMRTAHAAAAKRLQDDARGLGADGIIGISVETVWDSWYDGALEFMLTGTAIRRSRNHRGCGNEVPAAGGRPVFTAGLSGQDCWTLLRSGHQPTGFVLGYCAYTAPPGSAVTPRELGGQTRAIYAAREIAVRRMQSQARQLGATGIVGVKLGGFDELKNLPSTHILEFRATGTAIVPVSGSPSAGPPLAVLPVGS